MHSSGIFVLCALRPDLVDWSGHLSGFPVMGLVYRQSRWH